MMKLATRLLHRASTATTARATRTHTKNKNTDRASPRLASPRASLSSSHLVDRRARVSISRTRRRRRTHLSVRPVFCLFFWFFWSVCVCVCVCVLYGVFVYENTSVGRCGAGRAFGGVSSLAHGVKRGFSMERAGRPRGPGARAVGDGWIGIGSDSTTRDSRRGGGGDEDEDDDAGERDERRRRRLVVSSSRARSVGRRSR